MPHVAKGTATAIKTTGEAIYVVLRCDNTACSMRVDVDLPGWLDEAAGVPLQLRSP